MKESFAEKLHQKSNEFWKNYDVFVALSPSSKEELDDLQKEASKEAKMLLKKVGIAKGKKFLKVLCNDLDFKKLLSDMYVWERVDVIKLGIAEAIRDYQLKEVVGAEEKP